METITTRSPQPRPIPGFCFPEIFSLGCQAPHIETPNQAPLAILKYFPKRIYSLPSELYYRTLKTRIKCIKLIKTVPTEHSNKKLRVLLKNQRKNIKLALGAMDIDSRGKYNKDIYQLLKMFPNIQKIEFSVMNQYYEDEEQRGSQAKKTCWTNRISNYLNGSTHIKSVKLSNRGFLLLPLLSKLNSFETMLNRLEAFKLKFGMANSRDFPDLQQLLSYKTVLKNLTHLNLNLFEEEDIFPAFQLLPHLCSRLLSLYYCIRQHQDFWTFEEISYLKCLQDFQNLRKLSLYCEGKLEAFKHCKFPKSLRYLDLYFFYIEWESLKTKEAFFEKQEGLENLEELKISVYNYQIPAEEIIKSFIKGLLSRVLILREFSFEIAPELHEGGPLYYDLDLSHFFNCLRHLQKSLRKLTISDKYEKYKLTTQQALNFQELNYLSIRGMAVSALSDIENIINLTKIKPNAPPREIKLERIRIDSWKSLLEFLNSLKRISGRSIELAMFYESVGEDDEGDEDVEYIKENCEQVKKDSRNLRNVTLHIRFGMGWPRFRWMKELRSLGYLFRNFKITEHVYVD